VARGPESTPDVVAGNPSKVRVVQGRRKWPMVLGCFAGTRASGDFHGLPGGDRVGV